MTFNDDIRIDSRRVRTSRGRTAGAAAGGGIGLVLLMLILNMCGVPVGNLLPGGPAQPQAEPGQTLACETGADANASVECRIVAAVESLDVYWTETLAQQAGIQYQKPGVTIFEDVVDTACGTATTQVGPFYCPNDASIYIDVSFYDTLRQQFGSSGGPLAEMYVIAHEAGHHIQNLLGTMSQADRTSSGPTSDTVRLELQADCYAGMWAMAAQNTVDPDTGVTFLEPLTEQQVYDALSAASAVGDDRIQEAVNGRINPETWTHGSSEKRQTWFLIGMRDGSLNACDTFAVAQP